MESHIFETRGPTFLRCVKARAADRAIKKGFFLGIVLFLGIIAGVWFLTEGAGQLSEEMSGHDKLSVWIMVAVIGALIAFIAVPVSAVNTARVTIEDVLYINKKYS